MLHINEELFKIDDIIDEIVIELMKSDEVANYRAARENFQKDTVLRDKIDLLQENLELIRFRAEFRELQHEINLNEEVYQLKLAENDLQEILSSLAETICRSISEYIFIDKNLPLKGGSHHHRRKNK